MLWVIWRHLLWRVPRNWGQHWPLSVNQCVYSLHKQIRHHYSFDHNSAKWSRLGLRHRPAPILYVMTDSSSRPRAAPSPPRSRICPPFAGTGASHRCGSAGRKPRRGPDSACFHYRRCFLCGDQRPRRGTPRAPPGSFEGKRFKNRTVEFLQRTPVPRINRRGWKRRWLHCLSLIFSLFHAAPRQHQSGGRSRRS